MTVEYESDLRSNEPYLNSSEAKAWQKFSTGFKSMTSAILVECSTNWELVIMLVPNKPVKWWINNCKYMNIIYMWTADKEGFRKSLTYDIDINVLNAKSKNIGLSNFYEKKNNKKMKPCLTKQLWDMFRLIPHSHQQNMFC